MHAYLFTAMLFVYHERKFNTVELLKSAIITEWEKNNHNVSLTVASTSVVVVLNKVEYVVKNDGEHVEHCNLA